MNWLINIVVMKWVKGLLDKLPLNNYKTIIGVVLFVLTIVSQAVPESSPFIGPILELLKPHAVLIQDVALSTVLTGLIHKLLKYFESK